MAWYLIMSVINFCVSLVPDGMPKFDEPDLIGGYLADPSSILLDSDTERNTVYSQ